MKRIVRRITSPTLDILTMSHVFISSSGLFFVSLTSV
ncbi:hypothetical protein LINPERPRIM_LOCUS39544 [Linum perenne]